MLKITNKSQFVNYLIIIAVIVFMLNVVSKNLFFRWDATDTKTYSLSQSSKDVIGKLKDRLTAKVYFSDNLPGNYANSRRYVQDLLEEYQAYSDGQFRFEFINPDADAKSKEQAQNYQIPPVQLQAIENDKMEIKNVYMGMVLLYNDKKEAIPVIQTTEGLEYSITATIKKIASANLKSIGLISKEDDEVSTRNLSQFLEQIYSVRPVSLSSDIPAEVQTLIMNGVTDTVKLDELYRLDQFLMRGGKLFLAQGTVKDMLQQGFAMGIRSNIYTFLEHYGLSISKDLILDRKCSQIQIQSQQGPFMMRNAIDYPPFPFIQNFNTNHILTKPMTASRVFFVSEISNVPATEASSKVHFTPLMFTSEKTGLLNGPFMQINPTQNPMMKVFPYGTKAVAALVEGTFTSFFKDSVKFNSRPGFTPVQNSGQMIVITDNQFFNDKRAASIQENTEFILNSVDYLSGDEELIQIRSRNVTIRPLDELTDASRKSWKWANMVLPGLLVVVFGLYRWRRARARRKTMEEIYA